MSDATDKLLRQAFQARRENRLQDAKRDLVKAVKLSRVEGAAVDLARSLTGLGQIERDLDHNEAARQHYEEAVAIYRAEGDALRIAHTVRHVADIHRHQGHREQAERCYQEALALYRGSDQTPPLDLANAIRGLALLEDDAGEVDKAKPLWEEARSLYATVNVEAGVVESSRRLALLAKGRRPTA
jgi:tetratricopeptide (TPR) repeat protein